MIVILRLHPIRIYELVVHCKEKKDVRGPSTLLRGFKSHPLHQI
jgi:hypothetical protein